MTNKPQGRKPLSQQDLERGRTRILAAARKLFSENGYSSVSMRALARDTGMSTMSLYRYYASKRAILVHIWDEIFSRLFEDCRQAAVNAPDPRAALTAYAITFVDYWVANPENYLMVYGEIDAPEQGESFFVDSELVTNELSLIANYLAQCGIAEPRIESTGQQFVCAMHGVCHSLVTIPEMNWQSAESLIAGLVKALLAQQAREPSPGPAG